MHPLSYKDPIPSVSISPSRVCFYGEKIPYNGPTSEARLRSLENLKDNKHKGELSSKGSARVRDVVTWMAYAQMRQLLTDKHQARGGAVCLTLLTLTLPSRQVHTDKEIKAKCLNHFLIVLREKFQVIFYTWKAEKQGNGNIHFHIVLDKKIPWADLRYHWNQIIQKLGYVERYTEKMEGLNFAEYSELRNQYGEIDQEKIKRSYSNGQSSGWMSPNSIDIHKVQEVRNLSAYLAKYVGKKIVKSMPVDPGPTASRSERRDFERITNKIRFHNLQAYNDKALKIEGRIWACSESIGRLKKYRTFEGGGSLDFYRYFKKCASELNLRVGVHEYCTTIDLNQDFWDSSLSLPLEALLLEYCNDIMSRPRDKIDPGRDGPNSLPSHLELFRQLIIPFNSSLSN
jgi:hypothetical protein